MVVMVTLGSSTAAGTEAWCWERVVALLTAAGHRVATPTLAGLGDRVAEASPDTSVDVHAGDIVDAVRAVDGEVVLVAHSYAGAPAEVAAARVADRLARIVHLDSFAVDDGEALLDVFPPPVRDAVLAQVETTGDGWKVEPLPPAVLGLEQPEHIAAVMPRLTPQPLRTMQERVTRAPGAEAVPRTYVECLTGAATKPFGIYADRARQRGWADADAGRRARRDDHRPPAVGRSADRAGRLVDSGGLDLGAVGSVDVP